jgi:hypothetical protein
MVAGTLKKLMTKTDKEEIMTIRRVILEADAAEPICFLLTAYVEATRFYP